MSRKHAEESSLELLLDIVCNSFGGVIFIALLLAVIISIRGFQKTDSEPDREAKIAEVKEQITRLRAELTDVMEATRKQAELLETMNADPRLQLIREIALLERMHEERLLLYKVTAQKVNLSRSALKNLEIATLKTVEERQKTDKIVERQQALLEEKNEKLEELKKQIGSVNLKQMYFMTLVRKENAPYFIFVNDGKIWPVGPEIEGDSYKPNPAVNCRIKDGRYFCTPVPDRGIGIFDGEDLAAEFRNFLTSLPADRVPEFVISRSDAPVFYRLRDILKKRKVFHGFRMQKSDQDFFEYQSVSRKKGSYEY